MALSSKEAAEECSTIGGDPKEEKATSRFVLSFEDLTVYVPGTKKSCCDCRDNPISNCFKEYLGVSVEEHDPFYALDRISGYLAPGQMCLVMGGEQQNKGTLLRTLSGRPSSQDEIGGNVLLNGMPLARCLQGWRRLCPYISSSDQTHSAVLTVRETFAFVAQCTSDGQQSEKEIAKRVNDMLKYLALDNVGDTVVGDENLRGVSGGQKRRVTIGEMAIDQGATFLFCENITDGLSSSDSLTILTELQHACSSPNGYGAMVSLEQPSDEMVKLFDNVLILSTTGELLYFGPVDRMTLTEIFTLPSGSGSETSVKSYADLIEGYRLEENADELEALFVRRFARSSTRKRLEDDLAKIRSEAPRSRGRDVAALLPSSKYSTKGLFQFKILMDRRKKLISRNSVTWTRIVIAVVFGVIIGSLFSALERDLLGSLARTGYLFLNCFLVLMLSAAITIPSGFRDRVTLFKHRSAEFYSGRIAYVSQAIIDLPLSLLEATLLSTISYFWVDMRTGAGPFFYFLGTLCALECVGQALGRLLTSLFRKQVSANAASSVVILVFGTVGGFMPNYTGLPPILRWISWLTPISYAFEGLMINQFDGYSFEDGLVGIADNMAKQERTGGDVWLSMYGLPRIGFGSLQSVKIFNIFILFLFAIFYDYLGQMLLEKNRAWFFNQTRAPVSTVQQSFSMSAPNIVQMVSSKNGRINKNGTEKSFCDDWPHSLSASNLCYDVPLKRGFNICKRVQKTLVRFAGKMPGGKPKRLDWEHDDHKMLRLLNSVNVRFCRGRMCALMGTSGAGKTTLLDVIAGYKTGGKITGSILIDGMDKQKNVWKKISGYAEQQDTLNPYLTTLEAIRFTALCRVSHDRDRDAITERVLMLMNLNKWANTVVGREIDGEGLPKHARKRLTIALAIVHEPKILFLDEPTTGLPQVAARMVMESMKAATRSLDLILVATIHQPSKEIWSSFDDCCLLSRGGRVSYMGEIGSNSENVLHFFSSVSKEQPREGSNPADYCLAVLSEMDAKEAEDHFLKSDRNQALKEEIANDLSNSRAPPAMDLESVNNPFVEVGLLTVRHMIVEWRNPSYSLMRVVFSSAMSLYVAILFSGDKTQLDGAVFSIGAIFFLVFVLVIPMQTAVVPLIEDRAVLYRETVSGTYSRLSYGIGQLLADQPFHWMNSLLMFVVFYFLVDFQRTGEDLGYFILMLYLSNAVINSIGQLFALVCPNEESANGLGGLSVILSVILMGFLITVAAMPSGWVWAYWANLFRYILQGLVTNELGGREYFVNLTSLVPDLSGDNTTGILGFVGTGANATENSRQQIASIMSLVESAGPGTNERGGNFLPLINCTLSSDCFTDPDQDLSGGFISCYVFAGIIARPPCLNEFQNFIANVNVTRFLECIDIPNISLFAASDFLDIGVPELGGGDGVKMEAATEAPASDATNETSYFQGGLSGTRQLQNLPDLLTKIFSNQTDSNIIVEGSETFDQVMCLLRAILPPDIVQFVEDLMRIFDSLVGLIPVTINLVDQGGLFLPGEVILAFFGWAKFSIETGFMAPWKWWYCMGAVAIFLGFIESMKLFAISFIVWTNR